MDAYREFYGHYPEVWCWVTQSTGHERIGVILNSLGSGKPSGRPKKMTDANREELLQLKAQRREEYRQRIPIDGKFGQGKSGYRLNYIRAKRADTSLAWINSIFLVMNLSRIFFALFRWNAAVTVVVKSAICQHLRHCIHSTVRQSHCRRRTMALTY